MSPEVLSESRTQKDPVRPEVAFPTALRYRREGSRRPSTTQFERSFFQLLRTQIAFYSGNAAKTCCATNAEDCGFCPEINHPSRTANACQFAAPSNAPPSERSLLSN